MKEHFADRKKAFANDLSKIEEKYKDFKFRDKQEDEPEDRDSLMTTYWQNLIWINSEKEKHREEK